VTQREFVKKERMRVFLMKVDLEKTMRRDLKSYFAKQRKRIKRGDNIESIRSVLQKHYERIIRRLIHKNIKQEDRIENSVRAFLDNRASNRSNVIDNTSQENLEDAISEARAQLAEEGNSTPTERELMILASAIFARKARGRVSSIANTETQATTEGARRIITTSAHSELEDVIMSRDKEAANELYEKSRDYTTYKVKEKIDTADTAVLITILLLARKEWETMGDNLVRTSPFNHVAANGQRVMINEPFVVSGELLMYPGDSSIGASAGNVVNCRCVSLYL
jgi:ADP-heptose:LPS heptosyltransferase